MNAGESGRRRTYKGRKGSPDDDLPIGLKGPGPYVVVRPRAGIEGCIQRAVGVESGDVVAYRAVVGGEVPTDNHLPVRLKDHGHDIPVGTCTEVEGGIQRAIG